MPTAPLTDEILQEALDAVAKWGGVTEGVQKDRPFEKHAAPSVQLRPGERTFARHRSGIFRKLASINGSAGCIW
jgi:hypothetical protein